MVQVSSPDPTETSKIVMLLLLSILLWVQATSISSSPETTTQIHLFSTMPTWWSGALTTCEGLRLRC
uniref:Uncharacterized protein n=1 Tax=Triticum urartu TaxID=4572 RepID=A0A8R7VBM6_TRIUA